MHPVIVKISPLLMFCYISLMCPFLMNMNNQFVVKVPKPRMEENITQHFILTVLKIHQRSKFKSCLKSITKKTSPFTSMAKCYQEQILVAQQELPIRGIWCWKNLSPEKTTKQHVDAKLICKHKGLIPDSNVKTCQPIWPYYRQRW